MRLLLDTHVLLWWLSDSRRLRKPEREIISSPNNEVIVSAVSVWEVAIKAALGRIDIDTEDLELAVQNGGFRPLVIDLRHAATVGRLPLIHRDPFDRMLVA